MSLDTTVPPAPATPAQTQAGPWLGQARTLLRRPSVWLSGGWLLLVVAVSLGAGVVARQDPLAQDLAATFQLPSAQHWLGTDSLGRDLFSRLVHGGGYLLVVAAIPVAVSYLIGVPAGLLAGYVGGRVDTSVGFVVNVMFSVPGIVVTLAVAAATGNSLVAITLVLGVVGGGAVVRLVGASTRAAKDLLYVDAARVARLSRWRILLRHILPNVGGPLIVQGFLVYGGMFLFLTSLAFLSLGFSPETPSWGQMTYEASQNLAVQPWLMVPVGGAIILTVLSLNTVGAALLDILPTVSVGAPMDVIAPVPKRTAYPIPGDRDEDLPEAASRPPEGMLLAVRNLSVAIAGVRDGKPIVEDVTLDVRRGSALALVGESGSGKTLTALAVLGLLPPVAAVVGGQLRYGDTDLARLSEAQLRRSKPPCSQSEVHSRFAVDFR